MALPFPYDAVAGAPNDPAEAEAANLYRQYAWIARLADEMDRDSELDLKRAMQTVFHCRQLRVWYEALQARIAAGTHTQTQIADVIEGMFALKKSRWASRAAMLSDLGGLYTAAGTVADWIEVNAGAYKTTGYSINRELSPGVMTDEPIKVAKPAGLAARIADFRALFAASPASALKG